MLFALLSPIYYLNRWDFNRKKKRNPFYASALVRLQNRYPLLYDLAMLAQNFPAWHRVYDLLPMFSGDVLQVGCGTGLLNKHLRRRADVRFTNMDANANALRVGRAWGDTRILFMPTLIGGRRCPIVHSTWSCSPGASITSEIIEGRSTNAKDCFATAAS